MRISELAASSGVSVATLKFYLREGLLPRGEQTAQTQANYGEEHLARVRLIRALSDVVGMPLAKIREVIEVIDEPTPDPVTTMGRAVAALPPYREPDDPELALARDTASMLGLPFEPGFPATRQLQAALEALTASGMPWDETLARRYSEPLSAIARAEIGGVPADTAEAVEYAVLGTALHEPVMIALRRLHHRQLINRQVSRESTD